jgi:acyl-CoA-binding protein
MSNHDKELEENFQFAVNQVRESKPEKGKKDISNEEKLKFYALYKQATHGKCNISQPWAINVVDRAKWDSWNALGTMSQISAKEKYCDLYLKVNSHI